MIIYILREIYRGYLKSTRNAATCTMAIDTMNRADGMIIDNVRGSIRGQKLIILPTNP